MIFASFTTFAHCLTSASISARCSADVLEPGSTPEEASFARTSSIAMIDRISLLSRFTTAAGVFVGAKMPKVFFTSYPG